MIRRLLPALACAAAFTLAWAGAHAQTPWPAEAWNPQAAADDLVLPLPCGGSIAFRAIPTGAAFLTNRGCSRFFNFISNMSDPTGGRCWFVIVKADRTFVFCLEGVLVVGLWFTLHGWSARGFSARRTDFVAISVSTTTSSSPASPPVRPLRSFCGLRCFAVTGFIAVGIFGDGCARFFGETLGAGATGRNADHVLMVLFEQDLAQVIFGDFGCVGVGGVVSVRGG